MVWRLAIRDGEPGEAGLNGAGGAGGAGRGYHQGSKPEPSAPPGGREGAGCSRTDSQGHHRGQGEEEGREEAARFELYSNAAQRCISGYWTSIGTVY